MCVVLPRSCPRSDTETFINRCLIVIGRLCTLRLVRGDNEKRPIKYVNSGMSDSYYELVLMSVTSVTLIESFFGSCQYIAVYFKNSFSPKIVSLLGAV